MVKIITDEDIAHANLAEYRHFASRIQQEVAMLKPDDAMLQAAPIRSDLSVLTANIDGLIALLLAKGVFTSGELYASLNVAAKSAAEEGGESKAGRKTPTKIEISPAPPTPTKPMPDAPLSDIPWVAAGLSMIGKHEVMNNAELRAFLSEDGTTVGDPSQVSWCGDFVQSCLAKAIREPDIPETPFVARSWLTIGKKIEPRPGAIAVFWRRLPDSWMGHVGFVVDVKTDSLSILGGNQNNSVTITEFQKVRLLGCVWPVSLKLREEA